MAAELSERPSFKRRAGGGAARGGAAAKRACFDGGDDDDDGIRWRELTADERAKLHDMKLKDIPQWDCAMQSLLWRASFAYTLKAHQYKSTRFVAGVPDNWSPSDPPASWPSDAELDAGGGGILADVMGLGKTVSGLAGAVLRDIIAARGGSRARAARASTLVVGPNRAVLDQWRDHATSLGGFDPADVMLFRDTESARARMRRRAPPRLVLVTMHQVMSQLRGTHTSMHAGGGAGFAPSVLSPQLTRALAQRTENVWRADKGKKELGKGKAAREASGAGAVNAMLAAIADEGGAYSRRPFRTVLFDEAHFMRNPKSLWGMHAVVIGQHSRRTLALTGTPYNNRPQVSARARE